MNIVIPKSTLPGAVKNLANDVSEFGDVVKSFEDQKNLVTAQRIENDMKVQLDRFDAEMLKNSDGTEEKLFDKIRAGHDKIRNDYANQAPNFAVSRYLKQTGAADGGVRLRRVQGALDEKLYKTSVDAVKIKVDDEIRTALQTGEFGTGLQSIEEYMVAQSAFFGADTDKIATDAKQRYAYHYLKTGLTNPQTAPMLAQRLSDPEQKQMFFSMLPVEALDDMERLLETTTKQVTQNGAYADLYQRYGLGTGRANYAGAIKELRDPGKFTALNTDQRRELEGQLKAQQGYNEHITNVAMSKKYESELDKVYEMANQGHMTHAIDFINASDVFSESDKWKIKNSLATGAAAKQTDVRTYLEGVDIVYDPDVPAIEKKKWILTNGHRLSETDQKSLYTKALSEDQKTSTSATRDGIKIMENALVVSGMQGPTADARLKKAIAIYELGLKENADDLKTPEAKRDYAYQVLKMPEFLYVNPREDMKADMKRMRGVGMGPSAPPEPPSGAPKVREEMSELPPADKYKGKIVRDTATGERLKSDGKKWVKVK